MQKLGTLTVIALLGATPLSGQTLDLRIGTTRHEKTGFAAGLFTDRQVGPQAMRLGAYWMQVTHTSWSKGFIELPVLLLIGANARNDRPDIFAMVGVAPNVHLSTGHSLDTVPPCWMRIADVHCDGSTTPVGLSAILGGGFKVPLRQDLSLGVDVFVTNIFRGENDDDLPALLLMAGVGRRLREP